MSPYRRNVAVGAVVLGAILILAWMILKFAGSAIAPFAPARVSIHFISERADGLSDGANLTYRGVNIGQIISVTRMPDDRVRLDAQVDAIPPLPGNLRGIIRSTGLLGGGSSMVLELIGEKPVGKLQRDQELPATYIGLDFLPPEFAELAAELKLTARQFRESNVVLNLNEKIERLGIVIDSVQKTIGDEAMQKDLKESIANLRKVTEKADQIADSSNAIIKTANTKIDDLSKNIGDRLTQIAGLLDQFQQVSQKINTGKGTAGQLVNDPRLYESLADTAQELNATVKDLRRLVKQWEEEGVTLKMGK